MGAVVQPLFHALLAVIIARVSPRAIMERTGKQEESCDCYGSTSLFAQDCKGGH
jgi:hypothetical protein